mmetsp:Transcript_1479/g.3106  ORF Transcript_1479/g.3106 Transcript_1479/m.3106 type:complete len:2283 (+) Transcript_1479:251-7099(+)|eukprot:CAMPEP_0172305964 /NCGR_PEP_ID=MMETSP1058-20130122/7146_1 /TAXON_ID=83371 /ORGANISM="Detonula confervacea, Strain CCMP 353" /LENGTH=2282 /DNA_ID=CAMNT_0013017725 /DNA_START=201 /DNA_END=7049 /DNA_ORIENTATION=+
MSNIKSNSTLDEEYQHLQPHAFHLQLPRHHKTDGGMPYATIDAQRKSRAVVKLVNCLVLKEEFFVDHDAIVAAPGEEEEGVNEEEDSDVEDGDDDENTSPSSLHQLSLQCYRVQHQLSKLSSLKNNGGISQYERCEMALKVLDLLYATVEIVEVDDNNVEEPGVSSMISDDDTKQLRHKRRAIIHHDYVGCILSGSDDKVKSDVEHENKTQSAEQNEESLSHPFALPAPARQTLLNVALLLLGGKKDTLRGFSNSALPINDGQQKHHRLILSHHALLRMILRTAPYLDEHKLDLPPKEANNIRSSVLKKSVNLIRSCRRFFDQGTGTNSNSTADATAKALWSNLHPTLQYHTHSNSCFRALILLYLFHPTKCSSAYYTNILPQWMACWRNIDRCPEWDFLWMVLFSRARKFVEPTLPIWTTLRKHLLSSCKYWLQIPVGGISADKSFPHAQGAGKRSFPARLKVFVGSGGRYEEGMDFVGRLTKLLMFCCGAGDDDVAVVASVGGDEQTTQSSTQISSGASDILRFLSFITPYYNPSNTGAWTFPLGAFLHYLSYELCARVGRMAGWKVLQRDHADVAERLVGEELYLKSMDLGGKTIVALLDGMLPLCQQALYSKNATVSHAGETALLYLAQISPTQITPPLLDFSLRALDISSVNLSHQAPAALSALSRLLQPALRVDGNIVLGRLPDMLRLSLAGIDGNDQNKSLRTLIFYRNLVMWVPVGGEIVMPSDSEEGGLESVLDCDGNDGTMQVGKQLMKTRYSFVESEEYKSAIDMLPPSSVLAQQQPTMTNDEDSEILMQEAMSAMADWSLLFLSRIYELLRAAGESEKMARGHGGVGMRHTSADVAMTKNFSRIMKETLVYFFSAMDDVTYGQALRSVVRFLEEETLPFAVKDASLLCQAVCSTRFGSSGDGGIGMDRSPGLDELVPILTEDLEHKSNKCAVYRLRCLAGAVRFAGSSVLKHRQAITSAISYALSKSDDRVLFKTGCKLLRHALSSQCEEYPIAQCFHPMRRRGNNAGDDSPPVLGTSALLRGDKIWWHVPSGEQLDFTVSLLSQFVLVRWKELGNDRSVDGSTVNLQQWRQTLRVLRYSLRGCSGILLDEDPEVVLLQESELFCPKEMATAKLILTSSVETRKVLHGLRRRLCFNLMDIMCLIAKDTIDCESKTIGEEGDRQYKKNEMGSISADSKIMKEVIQLSELVLARRGAQYQSSTGKGICRGQKEILTDYVLASERDFISSALSRTNDELHTGINHSYYKDGEDSGKTVSRALLVNRIHLTNQDLTSHASSQVPRRLKNARGGVEAPVSLFSLDMTLQTLQEHLGCENGSSYAPEQTSLDAYEALVDGLCALSCHPNINVRGDALSIVDFALTRFGWVVKHNQRPSRLLAAISLNDEDQKGVHGIPSCSQLVNQLNSQGKRSRLGEVVKGVTKIVALPRVMKHFLWGASNQFELVKALCGTQKLLTLIPPEEVPKVVHYVNSIFLLYRSKLCSLPRTTEKEQMTHEACLAFLLGILQEGNNTATTSDSGKNTDDNDAVAMHWRDRLVAAWFVLNFIDERDLMVGDPKVVSQVWSTCFTIIEEEVGQPLQRVSLGLLGRLVSLALVDMSQTSDCSSTEKKCPDLSALREMFSTEKFCQVFGNALVFDHREDSSVGGGHKAQWSSGVEEIIRDATTYNLARRTLFPFNRISQKSYTFKLQHSQLVESILLAIGHENAKVTSRFLLEQAKELVASPPSEDQRNQQVTSAEIFGGVTRALIQYSNTEDERIAIWEMVLLPFLDEAVVKMPTNILAAFFDACRYGIHHFPPSYFFPLLKWSINKVQNTLWQHEVNEDAEESNGAASAMADRFALQGKWLLIIQAVLAELDNEDDLGAVCKPPFYTDIFIEKNEPEEEDTVTPTEIELGQSWKYVNDCLTPCLLNAIGHPYDKCRDHIASCLFRMCYCHRKFINTYKALGNDTESRSSEDPGIEIVKQLSGIRDSDKYSFKEKNRALGTARKFVACCVHWGDAKHEYSEFIIPLLPLAFKSLQTIEGAVATGDRGIESDLVKNFRYSIADISSSCVVSYGVSHDMTRVLDVLTEMSSHENWQIRQASAHFLRNFQGAHKFLFTKEHDDMALSIAISLLADDRREVSSAATSTLTGILAVFPQAALKELVSKYIKIANKSLKKKKKRKTALSAETSVEETEIKAAKERERATRQQKSVFVLCAVVMGRPYDTPPYIPEALAALSKHSFEQRASLSVREVVKMVCSEFKRTHTDNWEAHRKQFTQTQLEALEDVVSTPHYYA